MQQSDLETQNRIIHKFTALFSAGRNIIFKRALEQLLLNNQTPSIGIMQI
jgi:hypothetical protein